MENLKSFEDVHKPEIIVDYPIDAYQSIPIVNIERNEKLHAKKAKHLQNPCPAQYNVHIVRYPDGRLEKVDGITRSYVWDHPEKYGIIKPETVIAFIYDIVNEIEAKTAYDWFDNTKASKKANDSWTSAYRKNGLLGSFSIEQLECAGGLTNAAILALKHHPSHVHQNNNLDDKIEKVRLLKPELISLDRIWKEAQEECGLKLKAGVVFKALFFMVLKKWRNPRCEEGIKRMLKDDKGHSVRGQSTDGITWILNKAANKDDIVCMSDAGTYDDQMEQLIYGFEKWMLDKEIKSYKPKAGVKNKRYVEFYVDVLNIWQ